MNMTRTAGLAALLLAATVTAFSAAAQKLRIGVEGSYPPFSFATPSGQLAGFDIDLARALCAQMQAECQLVETPFDGAIPGLKARKFDAVVASMSITEERKRAVDFTDRYYRTANRFTAKKGAAFAFTAEGLKGKRIGVQRATIHDRFATDVFKGVEVLRYAKTDDVFLDLAAGRVDLALTDVVSSAHGFLKSKAGQAYALTGPEYTDQKYFGEGAGIALRKGDAALRERFNAALAALRARGEYQKIAARYFEFDIYGTAP